MCKIKVDKSERDNKDLFEKKKLWSVGIFSINLLTEL